MRHPDVVARLTGPLPADLEAPAALIPTIVGGGERPIAPPLDAARIRKAAVLVVVLPGPAGEARVLLTERVDRGGHHSGEVSFPGGGSEAGDVDVVATAIREAIEEVGLDVAAAGLRIVGTLPAFTIPVSGYRVTPVVAVAERRQAWVAQPAEVARIIEAPLDGFLPGAPIIVVERTIRGLPLRYGAYPVDDLLVWGATARILGQLGSLIGR